MLQVVRRLLCLAPAPVSAAQADGEEGPAAEHGPTGTFNPRHFMILAHLTSIASKAAHKYNFTFIPEYFVDYVKIANDGAGKASTQPQLGLLNRAYDGESRQPSADTNVPQWTRFAKHVDTLNQESGDGESYKLFYLIRHGTGAHNVIMEKVGSKAWKVRTAYYIMELTLTNPTGILGLRRRHRRARGCFVV